MEGGSEEGKRCKEMGVESRWEEGGESGGKEEREWERQMRVRVGQRGAVDIECP